MTQDEIMEMAREAGLDWHTGWTLDDELPNRFEAFAKLVAAKATEEANARANASWTLMCKKMVALERESIYHIVSHSPFDEAFDDGELQSEIGDALKAMAFSICAAIRARGEQA